MASGVTKALSQAIGMLNVVLMIAGLLATAGGAAFILASDKVIELLPSIPLIGSYIATFLALGGDSYDEIPETLKFTGYVLVAIGLPMFIVGLVGCCAVCFKKNPFLLLYVFVSLILCGAIIAVLMLWMNRTFDKEIFEKLKKELIENYAGITSFNHQSLLMNVVQTQVKCCGVENYTEYDEAANYKWDRYFFYNTSEGSVNISQVIPGTCCILNGTFPDVTPSDRNCTFDPTSENSYIDKSCKDAISDELRSKETIIIVVFSILAVFELLCAVLAIYMMYEKKKKKEKKEKEEAEKKAQNPGEPSPDNNQPNTDPANSQPCGEPASANPYSDPYADPYGSPYQDPYSSPYPDPYSSLYPPPAPMGFPSRFYPNYRRPYNGYNRPSNPYGRRPFGRRPPGPLRRPMGGPRRPGPGRMYGRPGVNPYGRF